MEGHQPRSTRGRRFAALLAVSALTFASAARAQAPLPPAGPPVRGAGPLAPQAPPMVMPGQLAVPGSTYYPGLDAALAAPRGEMGLLETARESLFGDASAEGKWRPLTLGTFFSEGWRESWAGGPAGQSGLTPRHGWLGSFEGLFYRLGLVSGTYQNNLNKPFGGEGYAGSFTAFLPFSRRFELFVILRAGERETLSV